MGWQEVLADLDHQMAAARAAELASEVADRTRIEHGRQRLVDRLAAAADQEVTLELAGAGRLTGRVDRVGAGWLLLSPSTGPDARSGVTGSDTRRPTLVALDAVLSLRGLTTGAREADVVTDRLGMGHVLRVLARDRSAVTVTVRDGPRLVGTIDRVGADHLDLAEHDPAEPRRARAVTGVACVPFAALATLAPVSG